MSSPQLEIPQNAPPEIVGAWFRFHELQLCQELDTVFVFRRTGFEAWCRIEDEKSYTRFTQLLEPLKSTFEIDVYPTHIVEDKKNTDKAEPPPSLSNNPELLSYLFPAQMKRFSADPEGTVEVFTGDVLVKQRILMYAEQVLDWNRRMRRYASELPAIACYGFSLGTTSGLRTRAIALCALHAQEVDRTALKLETNLKAAMPAESRRSHPEAEPPRLPAGRQSIPAAAQHLAEVANGAGRQVYRFIYPQLHTVALTDLKEPSLLQSLRDVRRVAADFQQLLRKPPKI